MANLLLKTRKQIESQKLHLEEPKTLLEFYEALPFQLVQFFEGMIQTLLERLYNQANERQQKRQKNYNSKNLNTKKVQKTVIFMVSIIVSLAFKKTKIWLTRILSSLCQKSRLISSFYKVLLSVNAISHTKRQEYYLKTKRMDAAKLTTRLLKGSNIWNVCVIDNIDFKEKSFTYGNIYDTTRSSSHATLRLVFQFQLPIDISYISNKIFHLNETTQLIDYNQISNEVIENLTLILKESLDIIHLKSLEIEFSCITTVEIINQKIIDIYNIGSKCLPAHLVILEAGGNPNKDTEISLACE